MKMSDIMSGLTTFGEFTVIRKLPERKSGPINLRKRLRVRCTCTKELDVPLYYLCRKGNPKTHCGCKDKTIKTHFKREYGIWHMMHVRTEDPRHVSYKDYGGRGIRVCAEWNKASPDGKGFERFLEFVGPAPSTGHSIDRVNNDLGYQPYQTDGVTRQVRWATAQEQRANQRVKS